MTPEDIDRIVTRAADRSVQPDLDPAAIARVKASLPAPLTPVRPMGATQSFVWLFVAAFAAVAACGGLAFGIRGFPLLSGIQRAVIFPVVLAGACMAAVAGAREMRPAGGTRMGPAALLIATLAPLAAFAVLFHNYDPGNFILEGVKCLLAGLVCAIPAAVLISLLLRRGFVLDWRAAGLAVGTLAGLAGIGMLELHCPILKAPHVMFWHVAVVWVSGLAGWIAGWVAQRAK